MAEPATYPVSLRVKSALQVIPVAGRLKDPLISPAPNVSLSTIVPLPFMGRFPAVMSAEMVIVAG